MRQHVNNHRLFSLMMLVSCFISLVAFSFFMVPLVSILTEFHCAWKEIYVNPHTLFLHTYCESRTVSWNDTSSAMYKNSVKRVNFVSWIDGGKNCLSQQQFAQWSLYKAPTRNIIFCLVLPITLLIIIKLGL